jgi:hypothetical protein
MSDAAMVQGIRNRQRKDQVGYTIEKTKKDISGEL